MSNLYSIVTYFSKFLTKSFKKSFLFSIIFGIGELFEKEWGTSYFKNLYPNENFLSILKRNKIIANHIFAPTILIVLFSIFLILSLNPVSFDLEINIAIGFVSFFIGSTILPRYFFNNKKSNVKNKQDYEKYNKNQKFSFITFNTDDIYSIGFCLVLVGVIFFFLSVASVGGIPLFKPSLRYSLRPILTMPVFLMISGIDLIGAAYLNKYKKKLITRTQVRLRFVLLIAISSFFLFALGYRTPIIATLLIIIIIGYYGKILALWEIVIGALLGIGIIIGIGYFRSLGELMITSNTSPFYSLQSRADFTLHVLNLLNYISGDFGLKHGLLTLSSIPGSELGPRMAIGKLIAWRSEVTVTPTLIGPMIVDFGRFGVAIGMGLLGFILGLGYKILQKTKDSFYIAIYAILLTYTILGIETGILDINVIVYFILGFLVYLANIFRFKKSIKL
ncbi:MAG: oligosaccharide repeat unit polymerase family protein [Methanobacteriaceae archaeon]|jgi:oligosaccharide repeat unit polymerase|nr:oligosaccharide repeat unit polymerase family protein [Candidatus Methanorudis spinitermitis]